ncbi:MAG: hypothetical protein DRJ47_02215 [Thermoprotei archaeon]|nr:MAG: hypothetical protein DRJ47_02215 [Thermoprotei archaeon]
MHEIMVTTITLKALVAALLASSLSAVLGVYVVLRRLSSLGAAIAHTTFAGALVSYIISLDPIIGSMFFGLGLALLISYSRAGKEGFAESIVGAAFGISAAVAALALSFSREYSSIAFSYLVGDVLGVSDRELIVLALTFILIVTLIILFYKELKYSTLDPETSEAMGLRVSIYEYFFNVLTSLVLVAEIRIVGLILAEVYLVAPAAAALQFTHSIEGTLMLAIIMAVSSALGGFMLSFSFNTPVSATIGILISLIYVISLLVSPKRKGKCSVASLRPKRKI